jgi:hypothetical protein
MWGGVPSVKCPSRRSGTAFYYRGDANENVTNNSNRSGPLSDYGVVIAFKDEASNGEWWWHNRPDNVADYENNLGPFRVAMLKVPGNYRTWQPRDSMAWWSDGTSNQAIIGEKHIPISVFGTTSNESGDVSYFVTGAYRIGAVRALARHPAGTDASGNPYAPYGVAIARPTDHGNNELVRQTRGLFGSYHPIVCNFAMGDGAVIDLQISTSTEILRRLGTVNDGEVIILGD